MMPDCFLSIANKPKQSGIACGVSVCLSLRGAGLSAQSQANKEKRRKNRVLFG
jgi:hypothetical protein